MEFPEQEEKVIAFIALGFAPFKPAHFKTAILLLDVFGEVFDPWWNGECKQNFSIIDCNNLW